MPYALRYCPMPGCPTITTGGRCALHRIDRRPSPHARGYGWSGGTRQWAPPIPRDAPCSLCPLPATTWDHYPVPRATLVALHVPDPDAPHRLRLLCTACHARQTVLNDGGLGHAARRADAPAYLPSQQRRAQH